MRLMRLSPTVCRCARHLWMSRSCCHARWSPAHFDIPSSVHKSQTLTSATKLFHAHGLSQVSFGKKLVLVGDIKSFGGWNPAGGLSLSWSEGHIWSSTLKLAPGSQIEFKVGKFNAITCKIAAIVANILG